MTFIERPISAGFLTVAALLLLWSIWTAVRDILRERAGLPHAHPLEELIEEVNDPSSPIHHPPQDAR